MQATLIMPSINNCTNYTRQAINSLNSTLQRFERDGSMSSEIFFNVTQTISSTFADSAYHCSLSAANMTAWYMHKDSQY